MGHEGINCAQPLESATERLVTRKDFAAKCSHYNKFFLGGRGGVLQRSSDVSATIWWGCRVIFAPKEMSNKFHDNS